MFGCVNAVCVLLGMYRDFWVKSDAKVSDLVATTALL